MVRPLRRRTAAAVAAAVGAAVVAGGALGACGDAADGEATGRFGGLHTAVCRAAREAEAGDVAAAQRTFDDVHVGLHDLAAAAGQEDRAVAARLLEAKQRVEAEPGAGALAALVAPVAVAVEVTGGAAPDDCP